MRTPTRPFEAGDPVAGSPYRITRPIGEGGMGVTYEAVDTNLEMRVALKAPYPELVHRSSFSREQMKREARALARLGQRTEHVVQVLFTGETADERALPYFVMELLVGSTLEALVAGARQRRWPIPVEAVVGIGIDLCIALDLAHRAGFVHRDIKGGNVFIHRRADHQKEVDHVVKLLDFGILATDADESVGGRFVGTPRCASPEQARGERVTAASDLYSLGLLLYELLTGHGPFDAAAVGDPMAYLHHHVSSPAPSVLASREVPLELSTLIAAALEKEPARRPASARAFGQALTAMTRRASAGGARPLAPLLGSSGTRPDGPPSSAGGAATVTPSWRKTPRASEGTTTATPALQTAGALAPAVAPPAFAAVLAAAAHRPPAPRGPAAGASEQERGDVPSMAARGTASSTTPATVHGVDGEKTHRRGRGRVTAAAAAVVASALLWASARTPRATEAPAHGLPRPALERALDAPKATEAPALASANPLGPAPQESASARAASAEGPARSTADAVHAASTSSGATTVHARPPAPAHRPSPARPRVEAPPGAPVAGADLLVRP